MEYKIEEMKSSDWEQVKNINLEGIKLTNIIKQSEEKGIWSLYCAIIRQNVPSIVLHKKCGFREIGIREKIAKMSNGIWHDVVLMERRSKVIGIN